MNIVKEVFVESWHALARSRMRSFLTMLGIVWGITSVTLLIAYGSGFRAVLVNGFDAFGRSVVIAWPGQTSSQAGGQRAGQKIRFEQADIDMVKNNAGFVKSICCETVQFRSITFQRPVGEYGDPRRVSGVRHDAQ